MLLEGLNEKQKEAVLHIEGPVMVVAGAGSGKTTVLTRRIAYLMANGVSANNILAVTFTNKAANEMKERIIDLVGIAAMNLNVSTFHSLSARLLRRHINKLGYPNDFLIIDDDDSFKVVKDSINELNLDPKIYKPRIYSSLISKFKNHQRDFNEPEKFNEIFEKYEEKKKIDSLVDFDDLMLYLHKLLTEHNDILVKYQELFKYILVDEFQDTNRIQFEIVRLLSMKYKNVFIVGDQDQSIYSFRGARYENIDLFINNFNEIKIIKLEENYRSNQFILEKANKLIKNNSNRIDKNLFTNIKEGNDVSIKRFNSHIDEVMFIYDEINSLKRKGYNYNDIAILYRSNSLSRIFEEIFLRYNMPYKIYGGLSFFSRLEVKDILAFLRIIVNNRDNFSFKRVINIPKRGIGGKTIENLEKFSYDSNISMLDAVDYFATTSKVKESLKTFKNKILEARSEINNIEPVKFIDYVINLFNYKEHLENEKFDIEDRLDNIYELKNVIYNAKGDSLNNYENNITFFRNLLEDLALKTNNDKNDNSEAIILSTYHQVKGLEFKVVFMPAMENGIFPSVTSFNSIFELEEERRICYVGITRARERLYLTSSRQRLMYGNYVGYEESVFLKDILNKTNNNTGIKKVDNIQNSKLLNKKVNHKVYGLGVIVSVEKEYNVVAFNKNIGIKKLLKDHPSYEILD